MYLVDNWTLSNGVTGTPTLRVENKMAAEQKGGTIAHPPPDPPLMYLWTCSQQVHVRLEGSISLRFYSSGLLQDCDNFSACVYVCCWLQVVANASVLTLTHIHVHVCVKKQEECMTVIINLLHMLETRHCVQLLHSSVHELLSPACMHVAQVMCMRCLLYIT